MRIDDSDFEEINVEFNDIQLNSNMEEIDNLIHEITITEKTLRRRNRSPNHVYITSRDINDIDDVIINIDTPPNYYENKERRIVEYKNEYILYILITWIYNFLSVLIQNIQLFVYLKKNKLQ